MMDGVYNDKAQITTSASCLVCKTRIRPYSYDTAAAHNDNLLLIPIAIKKTLAFSRLDPARRQEQQQCIIRRSQDFHSFSPRVSGVCARQ